MNYYKLIFIKCVMEIIKMKMNKINFMNKIIINMNIHLIKIQLIEKDLNQNQDKNQQCHNTIIFLICQLVKFENLIIG
jgi:hypothetical protein